MPALPLRFYGDPVLRVKAQPAGPVDDALRALAGDMAETMYANDGIGLAANQVGVTRRIVVVDASDEYAGSKRNGKRTRPEDPHYEVMLDPELLEASDEDDEYSEGCLSIPGVEGEVFRSVRVRARWRDLEGTVHEEELEGLRARVFQHEIDHIDGILFVDRMADATRSRLAGKLNQLRQKTEADLKGG